MMPSLQVIALAFFERKALGVGKKRTSIAEAIEVLYYKNSD
jgi:hypothetical protein